MIDTGIFNIIDNLFFFKGLSKIALDGVVLSKAIGGHQCLLAVDFLVSRNDANKNDNMCSAQCHPNLGMCEGQRSFEILTGKLIKAENAAYDVNSASC